MQPLEQLVQLVPGGPSTLMFALIFIAVILSVLGIATLFGRDSIYRRLVGDSSKPSAGRRGKDDVPVLRATQNRDGRWDEILQPLERYFVDQKDSAQSSLRARMLQAGFVGPNVVRNYFLIRTLLAVIAPTIFLFLLPVIDVDMSVRKIMLVAMGLGVAGLYVPGIWIGMRIEKRQQTISEAFPDALDMLVVCVEAGLGLDAAFTRVGTQIASAHPILASELGLVALELRAGKSREDALRNFSRRIGLREVSSFVTLLIQSDALGASIGQTLRIHAEEMRVNRMLRAEEKANKLPVKLAIPLVTCIMPSMFAAVMLPAMINIIRVLMPALG